MNKRVLILSLAMCVALLASCAKSTLISMGPERSDTYTKAKTIYVVLKTGETCEMRALTVTSDAIAGTRVLRNDKGKIVEKRACKIGLDEIATIQVIDLKSRNWLLAGAGGFVGLCLGAAGGFFLGMLVAGPW